MKFAHKVRKAFHLPTYTGSSAARAARRLFWHLGESPTRLRHALAARRDSQAARALAERRRAISLEGLMGALDPAELARIRRVYADGQASFWTKYLDVEKWLALNVRYVHELDLVNHPPREVLDLGCGGGFFLYVCRQLGARVQGVDLDIDPIFNELTRLFGVPRLGYAVEHQTRLPDFGGRKFDLITAWMICFNDFDKPEEMWRPDDWAFLLDDLAGRLTPDGRIVFSLNKQLDGKLYSEEIGRVFEERADLIDGKRLIFSKVGLDARAARRQRAGAEARLDPAGV